MKETTPPPNEMSKSQRPPKRHDASLNLLGSKQRERNSVVTEPERRRVSYVEGEKFGPEYYLG